jgi:hypothetical protein
MSDPSTAVITATEITNDALALTRWRADIEATARFSAAVVELIAHTCVRHQAGGQVDPGDRQVGVALNALQVLHRLLIYYEDDAQQPDGKDLVFTAAEDAEGSGVAHVLTQLLAKLAADLNRDPAR